MSEPTRSSRGFLVALFCAALALRVGAIFALGGDPAAAKGDWWKWGHEPACLARALWEGRGFADPWNKGTGASSWLTPPYPVLLCGLYQIFDGLNATTALVLALLQACASALTAVLLVELGTLSGSVRLGRWSGVLFALYPIAISNAVQLVWDTTFVAAALVGVYVLLLRIGRERGRVLAAGVGYGGLLFLNPAPMSLAPVVLVFVALRAGWRASLLFGACAFAVCVPWMWRNSSELGAFSLRPNFGVELRIGNHDEANGHPVAFRYHPSHVESELALYRELGEVEYARDNTERALAWIRSKPMAFARLCAKRVMLFWVGESPLTDARSLEGLSPRGDPSSWVKFVSYLVAGAAGLIGVFLLRVSGDVRWLLLGTFVCFGAPYYLSHVSERYRFPIDPLLVLCGAACVLALRARFSRART